MAKGHVTPHNMLARKQWQQPGLSPQDMRHTRFSGFQRGPQGVPHQSPHGQKLLARHVPPSPYSAKVTPTFAGSAQAATVAGIPYYDPNTAVPFVARFGDAPAKVGEFSFPHIGFPRLNLSPKGVERVATALALIPASAWLLGNMAVAKNHMDKLAYELSKADIHMGGSPLSTSTHVMAMSFVNLGLAFGAWRFIEFVKVKIRDSVDANNPDDSMFFKKAWVASAVLLIATSGFVEFWPLLSVLLLAEQGMISAVAMGVIVYGFAGGALENLSLPDDDTSK